MKKVSIILLSIFTLLFFISCGSKPAAEEETPEAPEVSEITDAVEDISDNIADESLSDAAKLAELMAQVNDARQAAIDAGAEIIGVNNRNLADFTVDINNSINLRRLVNEDILFISESGIKTAEDVRKLKENNVDAVLIGETLMRSDDKKAMIVELKNG